MVDAASSGSVLVVDDDSDIRSILSEVLTDEGYRVDTAANGREALTHLRSGPPPCVILLDLMMPVLNGYQFRQEQQRDPALAQIPVVVISADGNVKQKASQVGVTEWLNKPVQLDALLTLLQRFCGTPCAVAH